MCLNTEIVEILTEHGIDLVLLSTLRDAMSGEMDDTMKEKRDADKEQLVRQLIADAIAICDESCLDALTVSSTDEYYALVFGLEGTVLAHGADPSLVGSLRMTNLDPNPSVDVISTTLEEEGKVWMVYDFRNPATGEVESKRTMLILHDGYVFGSGYYSAD